jgi:hypothetical protein
MNKYALLSQSQISKVFVLTDFKENFPDLKSRGINEFYYF